MPEDVPLAASDPWSWIISGDVLLAAGDSLWAAEESAWRNRKRSDTSRATDAPMELRFWPVCALLYGLALENALKAVRVGHFTLRRESAVVTTDGGRQLLNRKIATHGLVGLLDEADESLRPEERELLERLQTFVVWAGRYPLPKERPRSGNWSDAWEPVQMSDSDRETVDRLYDRLREHAAVLHHHAKDRKHT